MILRVIKHAPTCALIVASGALAGVHLLRGAIECAPMTAPSDTEVDIARAFDAMTGPLTNEQREAYECARFAVLRAYR